ncbi:phage/plasmid primase, P4 family, partial [Chloroflexota bacterium]
RAGKIWKLGGGCPMNNPYDIACKLLSLGYSVIPSGGGEKHKAPLVNWTPYQATPPTEEQLAIWQSELRPALWGVVTNARVAVVDADTTEARAQLEAEIGAPHVITPRRGSHWYVDTAGHPMKTIAGLLPSIDVRGVGGFVNIAGGKYQILRLPVPGDLIPWGNLPQRIRAAQNGTKPTAKGKRQATIPETTRNAKLTSIAGAMRRQGADQLAIEAALLEINATQCQPPLADSEVLAIANSVARYEPEANDSTLLTLTDAGNSWRFVNQHGAKLRFNYERGLWLLFTGKRWEWDEGGKVTKLAKQTARSIYHEAAVEPDDNKRDALAKHAKASESNQRIKGMVELARAELSVTIEVLNADQYLLNCRNGTVDLRTGELRSHDPADLLTYLIPLDYDTKANSTTWLDFLSNVFNGNDTLIHYIQKCLGYSITGSQDEQALWFNYGTGSNGKTTLMGVILDILGDYATELDPLAFVADKNARTGPNEAIASLYNKRFVAATEVKTGMTLDVAILKRMTGGEKLRCERKFEHGFEFKPTHKLWLSGNHEPRITDTTNSIWNRLKYVPFTVTFGEAERIKGLRNTLARDHGEAILTWVVAGCLAWQAEGLGEPVEVIEAIQNYRDSQDYLHGFIIECCIFKKSATIEQRELYDEYKQWCETNDEKAIGKHTFRSRLIEKGAIAGVGNKNIKIWSGLRLRIESDNAENVTSVTANHKSSQEESSRIETSEKNGNKSNTDVAPEYPHNQCRCGGSDYWLRADNRWLCSNCHPKPKGGE